MWIRQPFPRGKVQNDSAGADRGFALEPDGCIVLMTILTKLFGRASGSKQEGLVARFDRAPLQGSSRPPAVSRADGLELLTQEGTSSPFSLLKPRLSVSSDFETAETWKQHRSFAAAPAQDCGFSFDFAMATLWKVSFPTT